MTRNEFKPNQSVRLSPKTAEMFGYETGIALGYIGDRSQNRMHVLLPNGKKEIIYLKDLEVVRVTFMDELLAGEPVDIDDYVSAWHDGDSKLTIYEFLGMTQAEYHRWVKDCDAGLEYIVIERKLAAIVQKPVKRTGIEVQEKIAALTADKDNFTYEYDVDERGNQATSYSTDRTEETLKRFAAWLITSTMD